MKAAKQKRPQPALNFQVPEWVLARVRQECERRGEIQGGVYGVARLFTDMCLKLPPVAEEGVTISSPRGLAQRREPAEPRRKPVKSVAAPPPKTKKAGGA